MTRDQSKDYVTGPREESPTHAGNDRVIYSLLAALMTTYVLGGRPMSAAIIGETFSLPCREDLLTTPLRNITAASPSHLVVPCPSRFTDVGCSQYC